MELIKKVLNYLLENPFYAVVVAVCFVAIVAVIIALCVKSSKSKNKQATQAVADKKTAEKEVEVNTLEKEVSKDASKLEKAELKVSASTNSTNEKTAATELKPAPEAKKETSLTGAESETKAKTPVPAAKKQTEFVSKSTSEQKNVTAKTLVAPATAKKETVDTEKVVTTTKEQATNEPTGDSAVKKSKRYNGKWVIWRLITKNNDGDQEGEETYFFELLASNGEKLLSSEEYTTFAGAQKGIQTHKANILKNNFRVCLTKKGDYIFKLLNGKNFLLCTGENYPTKIRCENAIESTKRFAETAVIDENIHDLIVQLPAEETEETIPEIDNGYNGKWVISSIIAPDGDQIYYFELFASNGEKLLSSEEYTTYNGVVNGIYTHKNNIERNNFRIIPTKRGDYIFKLLNANEQLLCLGEHYKTRRRCESAVESVKRFAKTAPIMDSPSIKKPISVQ
ncbi:MAG: DUF1508 domain-containing protein [Clostridia bacterium]|nr:DUF1508 domain-containing protein [Clostridia bacterium]